MINFNIGNKILIRFCNFNIGNVVFVMLMNLVYILSVLFFDIYIE